VALIDHHHIELVLGVVFQEELAVVARLALLGGVSADVECLEGRDEDTGVLLRVLSRHNLGVIAEEAAEGGVRLLGEAGAVADEQHLAELPGVGELPQQVDGRERLAGAGRHRDQEPPAALRDRLERGTDRGVLIVSAGRMPPAVGGEQRERLHAVEVNTGLLLVDLPEISWRGEVVQVDIEGDPGEVVVEAALVAVGGKDKRDVELLRVVLGLLEPELIRLVRCLRLHDTDRERDRAIADGQAEQVIHALAVALPSAAGGDHNRPWTALALDMILGPAGVVQRRVDQLLTGVRLGVGRTIGISWKHRRDAKAQWSGGRHDNTSQVCPLGNSSLHSVPVYRYALRRPFLHRRAWGDRMRA
jgi:hypothetical protein